MEEAINKATAAEMGDAAVGAPPVAEVQDLPRGIRQHAPGMGRTFEAVPPSSGPSLARGELPKPSVPTYGKGFGRISGDPMHIPKKASPNPQAVAREVQRKMGRGDPQVENILKQINDIGIQGEATQAPFKFPGHDPFLELMRKMGGG